MSKSRLTREACCSPQLETVHAVALNIRYRPRVFNLGRTLWIKNVIALYFISWRIIHVCG